MDIKEYISSGILDLYVLDMLPPSQRSEVEGYAFEYPEVREELAKIENALLAYSAKTAIAPPPGTEAAILKKIDNLGNPPSGPSISGGGTPSWLSPLLGIGLLFAAGLSFGLYQKSNQQQTEITSLNDEMAIQEIECAETKLENQRIEEQLRILRSATNKTVRMSGTDLSPQSLATIYWNPETKKTYLDVNNMPEPPSDKQYQLWAIVSGTPVDMGVFDIDLAATLLQEVPHIDNPAAFAVTLEPKGGSVSPTLDQMYVVGNVG